MRKFFAFCSTFLMANFLSASDSVVPNDKDYYKFNENNIEIIYTEDNIPFARQTAGIESPLNSDYKELYDWELDETLYVGLISNHNQIANGFSTQWPNNRQINYMGGTQLIDYFTTTSWLDTLIYHETAHNYQVNVKGSVVSRTLHAIFGNGLVYLYIPFFTVPNVMENSFMLEGNAVLNESWHGNGGRLYSGRFKVETILQAASGNIVASDVYNAKLSFPYRNIHYIQGGFYNLYLAKKYGMKRVNSYFRYHSEDFLWPEFTNRSMRKAIGVNFEDSLNSFSREYAQMAKHLVFASGEAIAKSQFFYSLSNSSDEIFFLTNESGVRVPELVVIDKKSKESSKRRDSWLGGKVIKVDDEYYTQGSFKSSLTKIYQGLYNSRAIIKDDTKSKMVQGYLSDSKMVYFDVNSSFSQAQLYVGDEFYAQVNSSVVIDSSDNIYYFVQNGKTRTLYKNRTPLYSYQGFYGIVSDVDSKGAIYFVASSEYGSTLYRYEEGEVTRAHSADNIIEARLLNDKEILIACVSEKDYYYVQNSLESIKEYPYETKLFFEDEPYYGEYKEAKSADKDYAHIDISNPYNSLLDMHYSRTDIATIYSDGTTYGNLSINFSDPLNQNSASVFASKSESGNLLAGAKYTNTKYLLGYSVLGYGAEDSDDSLQSREYGMIANIALPFYKRGRLQATLGSSYYQDNDSNSRDPLSVTMNFREAQVYGVSMYANYLNDFTLYGSYEEESSAYGAKYSFKHDLPYEFYFGLSAKYSKSLSDSRGVKISDEAETNSDPSTINMPSMDGYGYVRSAGYVDISLAKVINISSYWFTFPLSLQRESIYAKYRNYELELHSGSDIRVKERTVGLTLSTVVLNKGAIPVSVEYISNDAKFIEDEKKVRVLIDMSF